MRRIFAFNGDADGLCALQQLRLAERDEPDALVTGPKRRTALLDAVQARAGDEVTALDISFDANRAAALRLLENGARLRYFDHHHCGELPRHALLEAHIDTAPGVCTSILVDRHLGGAHRRWAVAGAFGDNLGEAARALGAGLAPAELDACERLGVALNYNSYGETEAELFFPPLELHRRLACYPDPVAFTREDPCFRTLCEGYAGDLALADALSPEACSEAAALYRLPAQAWARRVIGVFANRLAREAPRRAHALLLPNARGGLTVSVRAPLAQPSGAARLCLAFATGGGREAAAGIHHLEAADEARFVRRFLEHFRR